MRDCDAASTDLPDRWEIQKFFRMATSRSTFIPRPVRSRACKLDAAEWLKLLKEYQPTAMLTCWSTPAIPEEIASDPESPLKYICLITGTVRRLVPRSFFERGGVVTNWGPLAGGQVAEQALLLALASLRNISQWRQQIAEQAPRGLLGLRRFSPHPYALLPPGRHPRLWPDRPGPREAAQALQVKISAYSEGVAEQPHGRPRR